jgi:hypothetical protein
MKKYIVVISILLFISCKKIGPSGLNFYFENPQPINDAKLVKIPSKFRGLFMHTDSVFLNIKENIILQENFYRFKFPLKDMDSLKNEFVFINGKCTSKDKREVYNYRQIKDSIEFLNKRIDTFFILSNSQKAKRFDGKLVLSYKDSLYWTINSISVEKNCLKIKYIYTEQDLKRIDSLTKVKSIMIDSISFVIKPSRNEFKRILNLQHLGEDVEYRKVSKYF